LALGFVLNAATGLRRPDAHREELLDGPVVIVAPDSYRARPMLSTGNARPTSSTTVASSSSGDVPLAASVATRRNAACSSARWACWSARRADRRVSRWERAARRRPDLGTLQRQAAQVASTLTTAGRNAPGVSSLTAAELHLLPLLTTHLTFREIADRLYLSQHTVKSHAMAVYRKLGVTSRGAAVDRARSIGLL
jgi:ATP/maltotriose-dependent transcriptional regulator MalT